MARDYPTPLEAFEKVGENFKTLTVEDAAKIIAPHCRVHEAAGIPEIGGRDWVGPEGFVALMAAVQAAFNGFDFAMEDMVTDDDTRLAFRGRISAQLPAGDFDIPLIEYWTFEKGMAVDILPVWHDTKLVAELYAKSYPGGRV
jgi:SnoaL-like domain